MAKVEEYILLLTGGGMQVDGEPIKTVKIYQDEMAFLGEKDEVILSTPAVKESPLYITGNLTGLSAGSAVRYFFDASVLQLIDYSTGSTLQEIPVTPQKIEP